MIDYCWVSSPVGKLLVARDKDGLVEISFGGSANRPKPDPDWRERRSRFEDAINQLDLYFSGKLKKFSLSVTLAGTPFQRKVWRAIQKIPYGTTISYGQLARRIGKPQASRAVGAACGRNPVSIVTPCHRVIGGSGKLTGFGGGLVIKQALLALERHNL